MEPWSHFGYRSSIRHINISWETKMNILKVWAIEATMNGKVRRWKSQTFRPRIYLVFKLCSENALASDSQPFLRLI